MPHRLLCSAMLLLGLLGACAKPSEPRAPQQLAPKVASAEVVAERELVFFEAREASVPREPIAREAFARIEAYMQSSGAGVPFFDARLAAVATEYAGLLQERATLPRGFVEYFFTRYGIAEPYPKIVSFGFSAHGQDEFFLRFEEALQKILSSDTSLRVGIGLARPDQDTVQLILAMLPGNLLLEKVSRQLREGESLVLRGSLQGAYRGVRLVITNPNGKTMAVKGVGAPEGFSFSTPLSAGKGRYEVELIGDGASGPEVCGLFSVYVGEAPTLVMPELGETQEKVALSVEEAEQRIFALINAERKKAGLPALLPLPAAQKVARAYSEEMKLTGKVGHISVISGKPEERLKRGGVTAPLILENVARAYSADDAHEGLMESPGHRANILHSKVTHVGVGVAIAMDSNSPPAYYVTQAFVSQGSVDLKKLRAELPELLKENRRVAGQPVLTEDTALSRLAARYVDGVAAGKQSPEQAQEEISEELGRVFASSFQLAAPLVVVLPYLDGLAQAEGLDDPRFTHYGAALGVTKKGSPFGEGDIVLVLVVAAAR